MDLDLDGPQRRKLRKALIDAFPGWDPLRIMASDYLDLVLATVTAQSKDIETQAFDLIEWAGAHGRNAELVLAARYANPQNPKLFVVAQKLGLTSTQERKSVLEALVSKNRTFLDVAVWREQLSKLEWAMCRIDIDEMGTGTGFLIGPDVVLTNHHVVDKVAETAAGGERVSCLFDFKATGDNVVASGTRHGLATDWLVASSPHSPVDTEPDPKSGAPAANELDYALLRLDRRVGEQGVAGVDAADSRGWISIPRGAVSFASVDAIAILQHPARRPLKLAIGTGQDLTLNDPKNRLRYSVPTLNGSSGSPVFDADWNLIALHHAGDPDLIKPEFNEGIPIDAIASDPAVAAYLSELDDEE